MREGFLVVSLTWLLAAGSVSLPYVFSGESQLDHPVDALFEAMSGMTTSGGSILTDFAAVDRSMMIWRQFSQWIGGMGIVVLALAVLRACGSAAASSWSTRPRPDLDPLTTSIRDTARRLWILYVSLTVVLALVLAAFGWTAWTSGWACTRPSPTRSRPCRPAVRARSPLGRAVRRGVPVGDRALHGDRRHQLRAPPRDRPQTSRLDLPGRRAPALPGPARDCLRRGDGAHLGRGTAGGRGGRPPCGLSDRLDHDDDRLREHRLRRLAGGGAGRCDAPRGAHVRGRVRGLDERIGEGRPSPGHRQDPAPRARPDRPSRVRGAHPPQPLPARRADGQRGDRVRPALHRDLRRRGGPAPARCPPG